VSESRRFTESEIDHALRDLAAAVDYPPTPDLTSAVRHRIQQPRRHRLRLRAIRSNKTITATRAANGTPSEWEMPMRPIAPIDQLTGSRNLPERRLRHELLLALGGALVVLVAGMLYMLVFSIGPIRRGNSQNAAAPVTVPDTLIASDFDSGSQIYSLSAYLPGGTSFQPVLDNGNRPVISPDGRQLFSTQVSRDGDTIHIGVVALSSGTFAQQWRAPVTTFPASDMTGNNLASVGATLAVTKDRVYASPSAWGSRDPLTIVVLDRASGRETARWSIPLDEKNAYSGAMLYASPDGSELWVLDPTVDPTTQQSQPMLYLRVDTANGRLVDEHELTGSDGQPYYPYGPMAPDGHTLYTVGAWGPNDGTLAIQFFDLSSGRLQPSLVLPVPKSDSFPDHEEASSPDGRTLYILLPALGKVMIVDLQARIVNQVYPVEGLTADGPSLIARVLGTLRDLVVQPAAAKFYFAGNMQLSADGKRLYAVGVKGSGYEAMPNGIISIDTTTWQVIDRWLPDVQVSFIQLGSDGSTLYVQATDGSGATTLTVLDTRTGVASPVAQDLPSNVTSLLQLYRERYGMSNGVSSGTPTHVTPLARLDIAVDRTNMLAGDTVTVDARFVDPGSGTPVTSGQKNVDFEPPAKVTATFFHGQQGPGDVVVQLHADGFGHYRGSAVLNDAAVWSLQVDATRTNAPGSRAEIGGAVTVQSAFAGTDGRRYLLQLTTDPTAPVAGESTTVRVAIVDADSGTPLPDGVELTGGTPASLDAAYFRGMGDPGQSPLEMVSTELQSTSHGVYSDHLTFDTGGSWTLQINVRVGDHAVSVLAGAIQVSAP
jgi:hypothetical protein